MASCRLVPHNTWLKLVGYSSCGEQWISEYKVALRFQSYRGRDPPIPSPRPTILSLPTSSLLRSLIPLCSATSDVSSTSRPMLNLVHSSKLFKRFVLRIYIYIYTRTLLNYRIVASFFFPFFFFRFFFYRVEFRVVVIVEHARHRCWRQIKR